MPLYELVLDLGGHEEVRLTDQPLALGDIVQVDRTQWKVVEELPPAGHADGRFRCVQVDPD